MTRTLPCRKSSVPARVITALGLTIVAVSFSTGVAMAFGGEGPGAPARYGAVGPTHAARIVCERLAEAVVGHPVADAVVPVCKLVNGWD